MTELLKEAWMSMAKHPAATAAGTALRVTEDKTEAYWATKTAVLRLPYEEEFGDGNVAVIPDSKHMDRIAIRNLEPDKVMAPGQIMLDWTCDWSYVITSPVKGELWFTDKNGTVVRTKPIPQDMKMYHMPIKAWALPDGLMGTKGIREDWRKLGPPRLRTLGTQDLLAIELHSRDGYGALLYMPMANPPPEWIAETGITKDGVLYIGKDRTDDGIYSELVPNKAPVDMVDAMGLTELDLPPILPAEGAEEKEEVPEPKEEVPEPKEPLEEELRKEAKTKTKTRAPRKRQAQKEKEEVPVTGTKQEPDVNIPEGKPDIVMKEDTEKPVPENSANSIAADMEELVESPSTDVDEHRNAILKKGIIESILKFLADDKTYCTPTHKEVQEELRMCQSIVTAASDRMLRIALAEQKPDITDSDKAQIKALLDKLGVG